MGRMVGRGGRSWRAKTRRRVDRLPRRGEAKALVDSVSAQFFPSPSRGDEERYGTGTASATCV